MSIHEKRARMPELFGIFGMNTVGGQKLYELFGESYRQQARKFVQKQRDISEGSARLKKKPGVPRIRISKKSGETSSKLPSSKFKYNSRQSKTFENNVASDPLNDENQLQDRESDGLGNAHSPKQSKYKLLKTGSKTKGILTDSVVF